MWMFSRSDMTIIDVNEAATIHYGYSRDEFIRIRPVSLAADGDITTVFTPGVFRHKRRDGSLIMADITTHDIVYEGQQVVLVLANDITIKMHAEAELTRYRSQQQKLITETSIQVQEKEREEIGKELHDNINQILSSTRLYLEYAITEKNEDCQELLHRSYKNLNRAIEEIRQLTHKLVAPSLGAVSLIHAINELMDNIMIVSSLKIELQADDFSEDLIDKNMMLMFYRIVQEQLNNILKHAQATKATIELKTTGIYSLLSIEDNGKGFDLESSSAGIGLRNIRNRVSYYNGTVNIITAPKNGCRLEIIIPLNLA